MHVEHVDFVSFSTQDIQRAKHFYGEILGLEIETEGPDDMEFRAGQVTLDIFSVPDVHAARAELEAKGVEFGGETLDTGVCNMAFFKDPDGNSLILHRRYAPKVRRDTT